MNPTEDRTKMRRLKDLLTSQNLNALVLQLPENVSYVSDYWPLLGMTFVVVFTEHEPTLIHTNFETPVETWISDKRTAISESPSEAVDPFRNAMDKIKQALEEKGLQKPRVGYEGSFSSIGTGYLRYRANSVNTGSVAVMKQKLPDVTWVDATDTIYEARLVKTKLEVEKLKIANKISAIGLKTMFKGLKQGVREVDLAVEIERQTIREGTGLNGAAHIMACAFLSSGEFTAETYGVCFGNRSRKMRNRDFVMLEYDVVVDGYSSDMTRTYVVGQPNKKQMHLLETVYEAQLEGVRIERGGTPAKEVDNKAREVITKGGYGKYIRHYFGHGIGVTIWEPKPYVHSKSLDILKAGMVHSAEPGAYVPNFGGVRIEDNIYLSNDGPVRLSTYLPLQE